MDLENFPLQHYGPEKFTPGLERLKSAFEFFKPKFPIKIITIAGTNGKGETALCLAQILSKQDFSYGLWTSPHLETIRERFCFNGSCVSTKELADGFQVVDKLRKEHAWQFSYYEFLFFTFLSLTQQKNPDYLILEVGLGGRLDAVNLFDADIAALTSISLDHTEILGRDEKSILLEKLGVTRKKKQLISNVEQDYLKQEILHYTREKQVEWKDLSTEITGDSYSQRNRLLAQNSYEFITGKRSPTMTWKPLRGRQDMVTIGAKRVTFIGAHNVDGIHKTLALFSDNKATHFLVSFSRRPKEDLESMAKEFRNKNCSFTEFKHERAAVMFPWIENFCDGEQKKFEKDWQKKFLSDKPEDPEDIVVMGSYFFISEVRTFLKTLINYKNTSSYFPKL